RPEPGSNSPQKTEKLKTAPKKQNKKSSNKKRHTIEIQNKQPTPGEMLGIPPKGAFSSLHLPGFPVNICVRANSTTSLALGRMRPRNNFLIGFPHPCGET
ncbi:hypothetical protein, partial [Flaviflexus huanghaiensis]|uniref:hypothetical protein n=1 Tax=Flaviflexus huanghaiensis TaxID=1111473 RepID=UPI0019D55300